MDRTIVEFFRRASNAVGLSIQYIITGLFSRLLTIVVGAFFGINVYRIFEAEMGIELLSLTMAIIAAFGVEAVGFMATHRAVKSYEDGKPMFIPLLFVAVYLLVSIGALMFADVSLAYRFVSVGIVILIGINYALIGMENVERNQARAVRNEAARADTIAEEDREFAREQKRTAAANRQAVKMAQVSAPVTTSVIPSDISVIPSTQSSDKIAAEMIRQVTEIYEAFAEGQKITTTEAAKVSGKSARTMQKVMAAGVSVNVFDNPKRGAYYKNGVNPSTLWGGDSME